MKRKTVFGSIADYISDTSIRLSIFISRYALYVTDSFFSSYVLRILLILPIDIRLYEFHVFERNFNWCSIKRTSTGSTFTG